MPFLPSAKRLGRQSSRQTLAASLPPQTAQRLGKGLLDDIYRLIEQQAKLREDEQNLPKSCATLNVAAVA